MDFLLKVAYYAATSVSGLIILGLYLANFLEEAHRSGAGREKVVMTLAAAAGLALLYFGVRLGHQHGRWLAGLGLAVGALLVAGAVMLAGMLTADHINWQ